MNKKLGYCVFGAFNGANGTGDKYFEVSKLKVVFSSSGLFK